MNFFAIDKLSSKILVNRYIESMNEDNTFNGGCLTRARISSVRVGYRGSRQRAMMWQARSLPTRFHSIAS